MFSFPHKLKSFEHIYLHGEFICYDSKRPVYLLTSSYRKLKTKYGIIFDPLGPVSQYLLNKRKTELVNDR